MQTSDILYYEVLDITLPVLQGLKTLKVAFHHATKDEVSLERFNLLVSFSFHCVKVLVCSFVTRLPFTQSDCLNRVQWGMFLMIWKLRYWICLISCPFLFLFLHSLFISSLNFFYACSTAWCVNNCWDYKELFLSVLIF